MPADIAAVAFDLDGTLYPNYRFYRRLIPLLFVHPRFYRAFLRVRHDLHRSAAAKAGAAETAVDGAGSSFYDEQARRMALRLGGTAEAAKQKTERFIYRRWEELFSGIKLFPQVTETLTAFRTAGLKLALLSDFPPVRKLSLLGLGGFFDVILSTEETGALKPSALPFAALAQALGLDRNRKKILYVGNSPRFDAAGARRAGMRAALIRRNPASTGFCPRASALQCGADFVFFDYRQLREYVIG
ncbi:phosphoglycolate phosphatase [Spirochaetia bacterium]|nr:phosphoglycolate phosphatase [Spirochaetia bacterium]